MSEQIPTNSYWKSLGELARNKEYESYLHREFGEQASELPEGFSRKNFLQLMGASIAMAGFASCRRPVQKILPYSRQPEDMVLGIPMQYASVFPFQDAAAGILIENNEGRPSKIEGNPDHPSSMGRSSLYQQAAILNLYDPDRSRGIRRQGSAATKEDFLAHVRATFGADRSQRILFISEEHGSPTFLRLKSRILREYPNAAWTNWEAFGEGNSLEGARMLFGQALRTVNHYDRCDLVVALDDDFMSPQGHKNAVENAAKLTGRRKVRSTEDAVCRLIAVEGTYTITGSYADTRVRLRSSEVAGFTFALAAKLNESLRNPVLDAFGGSAAPAGMADRVDLLAADLLAARGRGIVSAGLHQPAAVHAAAAAINLALGNASTGGGDASATVTYHELPSDAAPTIGMAEAVRELADGGFASVVIIGSNPVFTAPADLRFSDALGKAGNVIHLADYVDETSAAAGWHVNRAHFLEAWGDGRSFTGLTGIVQPQIQPLHGGVSDIEFLQMLLTGEPANGYDLVRDTWQSASESGSRFQARWERILHDGYDAANAGYRVASPRPAANAAGALRAAASSLRPVEGVEILIRPDAKLFDGRYANNGWLMELPDPMTKITWDNVALMSPATATSLGLPIERHLSDISAPIVRISANGASIEIPAWIQPGHADNAITLTTGYGRTGIGRVADGAGVNVYPLLASAGPISAATVETTGRDTDIACTQAHHSLEGRDMIRVATVDRYRETPEFASYANVHGYEVPGIKEALAKGDPRGPISLFNETYGPDYEPQWGMSIDLNACFGCGVCTIACQAENNIPVIGKKEVSRRRIMHWIRTDRYFEGDTDNPKVYHQPVPCMHCELAPCEQVCPVAATTHSDDGMNQMTYNRCIGTRYCSNNCPFKVRRFNFFNYTKEYLTTGEDPEIIQMAMNPEVTVRFRGVMEKCTYCVQRVNRAKIDVKRETGSPRPADGTVLTACQQACPANAISFGDITDPASVVSIDKANERSYAMLEELNVRPRTTYMAKLRNPIPELEPADLAPASH